MTLLTYIVKFTVSTQLLWGDASVYECACCKFKLYRVMQLAKENGTTGQNYEIQILQRFFITTRCIGCVDTYCTNRAYIIKQYIYFRWLCAETHCVCSKHSYCFASQRIMCESVWINAFILLDKIYSTQLWRRLQKPPTEDSSSSMVKRDVRRASSTGLLYSGLSFLKMFSKLQSQSTVIKDNTFWPLFMNLATNRRSLHAWWLPDTWQEVL